MPSQYYVVNCEDPDEGYLARLSYQPDDPRRSWILGERFSLAPPEPVRATIRGLGDDETVMAELWKSPVPVMSRRLLAVLREAGVSNLDVYAAALSDPSSGKVYDEFVAFNVIGKISAVDLSRSSLASGQVDQRISMSIDHLQLDEARIQGALMFRLAEAVSTLVVHASIKDRIEAAGIDTLTFYEPSDWAT